MNKKAQAEGPVTLKKIIIALIVILTLIAFVVLILIPAMTSTYDKNACKLSAAAASKTKILGTKSPFFSELKCKTQFVDIKKDGVYKNDKKMLSLGRDMEKNEEKIKRTIANEMYDCWDQMGKGELDPFSNYESKGICIICSEITFDKEVRNKVGEIEGFYSFLKNEEVPEKGVSYWEYLTGSTKGLERLIGASDKIEQQPISTKEDYSVVFTSDREVITGGAAVMTGTTLGGCVLGVKAGMVVGGAIGSVAPGPGTAIGAVVGGVGGCIGGLVLGNRLIGPQTNLHTLAVGLLSSKEVAGKCEQLY